jgi:hypothetical protein
VVLNEAREIALTQYGPLSRLARRSARPGEAALSIAAPPLLFNPTNFYRVRHITPYIEVGGVSLLSCRLLTDLVLVIFAVASRFRPQANSDAVPRVGCCPYLLLIPFAINIRFRPLSSLSGFGIISSISRLPFSYISRAPRAE